MRAARRSVAATPTGSYRSRRSLDMNRSIRAVACLNAGDGWDESQLRISSQMSLVHCCHPCTGSRVCGGGLSLWDEASAIFRAQRDAEALKQGIFVSRLHGLGCRLVSAIQRLAIGLDDVHRSIYDADEIERGTHNRVDKHVPDAVRLVRDLPLQHARKYTQLVRCKKRPDPVVDVIHTSIGIFLFEVDAALRDTLFGKRDGDGVCCALASK